MRLGWGPVAPTRSARTPVATGHQGTRRISAPPQARRTLTSPFLTLRLLAAFITQGSSAFRNDDIRPRVTEATMHTMRRAFYALMMGSLGLAGACGSAPKSDRR